MPKCTQNAKSRVYESLQGCSRTRHGHHRLHGHHMNWSCRSLWSSLARGYVLLGRSKSVFTLFSCYFLDGVVWVAFHQYLPRSKYDDTFKVLEIASLETSLEKVAEAGARCFFWVASGWVETKLCFFISTKGTFLKKVSFWDTIIKRLILVSTFYTWNISLQHSSSLLVSYRTPYFSWFGGHWWGNFSRVKQDDDPLQMEGDFILSRLLNLLSNW